MVSSISGSFLSGVYQSASTSAKPTKAPEPSEIKALLASVKNTDLEVVKNSKSSPNIYTVEKHVDDVQKNRGYLSSDTAGELKDLSIDSAFRIANLNPQASLSYSLLLGSLRYDQKARFIQGAEQGIETAEKLRELNKLA